MNAAPGLTPGHARSLLGAFLFNGEDVFKKVGILSGGEKSRVALAEILVQKANLVVLDEPTNHLDYKSRKVLQKALVEFPGALVIVSHDIEFLRPVTNKVLELKNGKAKLYYGGIDYYLEKRRSGLEDFEAKPPSGTNASNSRKSQKRQEAEMRQKKYEATKHLKTEIESLELKIEELEESKKNLESELSSSEVFQNPALAKTKNIEYDKTKKELDLTYFEWEKKTAQMEEMENQFTS